MEWGKSKHLGAVDRALTKKVLDLNAINRTIDKIEMDHEPLRAQPVISNRTGLRDAMAAIKEQAAKAREKSMAAGEKVKAAFEHQARVTESVVQYADDVVKESDEVLAELGQFSNGGPV